MVRFIGFLLFLYSITSCGIDTKFSDEELAWLSVYAVGDTLIFETDACLRDTSIIVSVQEYQVAYNPIESHGMYQPRAGHVWYTNKALKHNPQGDQMISMYKVTPNRLTFIISYLYSGQVILFEHEFDMTQYKYDDAYIIDSMIPIVEPDPNKPKTFFWHKDYGLVKYITNSGEEWKLVGYNIK